MAKTLTLAEQRAALNRFFLEETRNLEAATTQAVHTAGKALKRRSLQELRTFRRGRHGNGGFQKAVKIYPLPSEGTQGPASFVRLGVPFIGVFQEGATISGRPNLGILLPSGEALGYRRLGPGNPWSKAWQQLQRDSENGIAKVFHAQGRQLVAIMKNSQWVGVYLFQPQVTLPKKLSFYEIAEEIANRMPAEIERLLRLNDA